MRYIYIFFFNILLLSCKSEKKIDSSQLILGNPKHNEQMNSSFLSFIKIIPEISLPFSSQNYQYLLVKQEVDEYPNLYLYTVNQNKLKDDMIVYDGNSYEFSKLKNVKSYKYKDFVKKITNQNLHEYALERYRKDAKDFNDNIFFNIPILRFKFDNTYVIGFLTVVASENDNSYAEIRLHTYNKDGVLMIDKESKTRGISLIYSFMGELGIINIHSSISIKGVVKKKIMYLDEEGQSEEIDTYQITSKGFEPIVK